MAQAWLFGVCAILCLVQGADAIKCKKCVLKDPYQKCYGTCEVFGKESGCIVIKKYEGRNIWHVKEKWLNCFEDRYECRPTGLGYDIFHKYCCSDGDFCNSKL